MKLTQKAIDAIKKNKRARARLQLDLDKSEYTINKYIAENDIMLTTAQALKVIREETGLDDSEVLELSIEAA
jgi:NAD kinase